MNTNAIITKGKVIGSLLQQHLGQNGHFKDAYTDWNNSQYRQCMRDLHSTHWTQETEELRSKWSQNPEEIKNIGKNIQIIK